MGRQLDWKHRNWVVLAGVPSAFGSDDEGGRTNAIGVVPSAIRQDLHSAAFGSAVHVEPTVTRSGSAALTHPPVYMQTLP